MEGVHANIRRRTPVGYVRSPTMRQLARLSPWRNTYVTQGIKMKVKVASTPRTRLLAPATAESQRILTPEALNFVARLHSEFGSRRLDLLEQRQLRWRLLQSGKRQLEFAIQGPAL